MADPAPRDALVSEGLPRFRPVPLEAEFRLPSDDEHERVLVEANERARAYSADVLHRLLPELDVDGAGPMRLQTVDRARLARLFDLDTFEALVDHGVERSRVGLSNFAFLGDVVNGSVPPADALHGALAGRAMRDGGRVVLTGLERATPGMRRLAEHLGRVYGARVAVRAVAGSGAFSGDPAAVVHSDHLLVPIVGHRHVTVELSDDTGYDGPLAPGAALHLPTGARLANHSANELFLMLEIQIDLPSPRNVLPLLASTPDAAGTWADHEVWRQALLARWRALLPTLPATPFSATARPGGPDLDAEGWLRATHTGGWCRRAGDDEPNTIVAAGIGLFVPEALWPLLAEPLAGPPVPTSAVATDEPSRRLVSLLVDSGLCELLVAPDAYATWDAEDVDAVAAP